MDKLLSILNRIKPEVDFADAQDLVDEGVLDSIDIVTIVTEIEEEFSVTIDPDEIDPDNFQSADAMLRMIEKLLG